MANEFQDKVQAFMDKHDMNHPIENRMLDLFDEVGEVAKEINTMSLYGTKEPMFREEIKMELGDTFYSLIGVANYYHVDLLACLDSVLEKYRRRIERGGHPGSENE